jgi:hypothetical protein
MALELLVDRERDDWSTLRLGMLKLRQVPRSCPLHPRLPERKRGLIGRGTDMSQEWLNDS